MFDKIADRVERILPILNQKDIDDLKEEIEEEFNLPKITQKIIIEETNCRGKTHKWCERIQQVSSLVLDQHL